MGLEPGSTRTVFHHLAMVSVGPTLTTKSSWQVKLNSREIYQFAKNTYLGGLFCAGDCTFFDDILEFNPLTEKWKKVSKMTKKRSFHSLSTIQFESGLCNSGSFLSGSVLLFLSGLMAKWFIWGKVGLRVFWNPKKCFLIALVLRLFQCILNNYGLFRFTNMLLYYTLWTWTYYELSRCFLPYHHLTFLSFLQPSCSVTL